MTTFTWYRTYNGKSGGWNGSAGARSLLQAWREAKAHVATYPGSVVEIERENGVVYRITQCGAALVTEAEAWRKQCELRDRLLGIGS